MNGYDENPMNWTQIVWRLMYAEDPEVTVWATDLVGAIKESECDEVPVAVVFHDKYWLPCFQSAIRSAMKEVRAGGMGGAIAA